MSVSEQVGDGTEKPAETAEPAASESSPAGAALSPPEAKWSEATKSTAPPLHEQKPARRRFVPILVTALIAVILGLGVALFVILKFGGGTDRADIAKMQQEIGDLQSNSSDVSALNARLQALEKQGAAAPGDSALASRLASVEQSLGTLSTDVSTLQQSGASTGEAGTATGAAQSGVSQAALDEVKNQLAQLTARIDALEKSLKDANTALSDRVSALEQKIPANLADQLAGVASKGQVDGLAARIATLEASTTALDAKRAAAAIALANLARAAGSGSKFTDELAAVRLLDVDQETLKPITPYAEKGVAPMSEIVARFDGVARAALSASRAAAKDGWSRFWASLSDLFAIRRIGPMAGNSDEAILARAGDDVHAGNLQAALGEIAHLSAPAAKVMAPWQADAKARAQLDRLVNNATAVLIANLASVPAQR